MIGQQTHRETTSVESASIVRHLSNHHPLPAPCRRDATRHLDIIHLVPHSGVRSDQLLKPSPPTILILLVQTAHDGSSVRVGGGIEQTAEVTAGALADKVCIVSRSAVRDSSGASSKGIVQALSHILQSIRNGVSWRRAIGTEDLVVDNEVMGRACCALDC